MLIALTDRDGSKFYLNVNSIVAIYPERGGSRVWMNHEGKSTYLSVIDSPDTVQDKLRDVLSVRDELRGVLKGADNA